MSEAVDVQKLVLSGLLSAWFIFGGFAEERHAMAAGPLGAAAANGVLDRLSAQTNEAEPAPATEADLEDDVPFSELNEALTAARSRLTELTKAAEIAKVVSELREKLQTVEAENRQLKSVLSQLQTDNDELVQAKQNAERRVSELETVAEEANAEAQRLDEELVSMRWQNSQLTTSLTSAETLVRQSTEELTAVRNELGSRAESLAAAAEDSAVEIARLQRELDDAREQILTAEQAQASSAAELVELRKVAEDGQLDTDRLARDLDATITDLADSQTKLAETESAFEDAKISLTAAEQEVGILRTQLSGNREETDDLKRRLESAELDLENTRSLNGKLERQVEVLKAAAGEATDAARQNLLAVENQINEINAALASVKAEEPGSETIGPAGGPVEFGGNTAKPALETADNEDGWLPRPSPPRADVTRQFIAASSNDRIERIEASTESTPSPEVEVAALEQGGEADTGALIDELNATRDARGLTMTVPGALLFAVNSDQIESSAHDALASVAELVNIYDEREVLIIGHTDAVGDAGYNQQLSERRAELVKSFFIDEFEIDEERLKVEGQGEQNPITSNATADGRSKNRRIEVVILE
jgi:outer membrane protein OmpA-like peptidoglycan-associated protein/predicted  nucleic acid-binding Zn-ribbon protein